MPRQPDFYLVVDDPSKPERSLTPAKIVKQVEAPRSGVRPYWIKGAGMVPGLALMVRPPTAAHSGLNATWVVQAVAPTGKSHREKIARFGELPVRDVIDRAIERRSQILAGTHKQRKVEAKATADRNSFTVGQAFRLWVEHLEQHKRPTVVRNAIGKGATAEDITAGRLKSGYIKQHFSDWLSKPLASLTKLDLRDRHIKVTKTSGPTTGNRVLRALRAAWNHALGLHEDGQLPPNLLAGAKSQRGFAWNEEKEGGERIPFRELPGWWAAIHDLPPVRRDWNLVALFTAARRNDVKAMRWEHIDLERGTIHFPEPKGGARNAYTIPVAAFVLDVLRRRRAENRAEFSDDRGWVFPIIHATEGVTHIRQPAEMRYVDGKKVRVLPSPHMLRRTWITAADGIVPLKHSELLANHTDLRMRNRSHDRYNIPDEEALRDAAERVAMFLLEKAGAAATIYALRARSSVG
jgi:integrase